MGLLKQLHIGASFASSLFTVIVGLGFLLPMSILPYKLHVGVALVLFGVTSMLTTFYFWWKWDKR